MPKQVKKVLHTEEIDESESDHIGSATDEENESEAGESEAEDSAECESEDKDEEAPALDASATESDEEEDEVTDDDDDDEEEEESEEDDEVVVKETEVSEEDDEEEDDEVAVNEEDDEDEEEEDDDDDDDKEEVIKKVGKGKKLKNADDDEDGDEVDDDKDVPKEKQTVVPANLIEKVTKQLTKKYEGRKGLQLFIRLPEKLPEDFEELESKVKSLSPLIVKVHKPRQKYARFCLVDFANKEDRDKAYALLSEVSKDSKLVVSLPRIEQEGFVEKVAEKRAQKLEQIRANKLLKKESKHATIQEKFTSHILVYNIPKSASLAQIKELFPDAVDIQLKPAPKKFVGVCTAAVTCPSTRDAKKNQKRKLTLGSNKLFIRFNNVNRQANKNDEAGETRKGPLAPKNKKNPAPKKNKQPKPVLGKKRLSDGDGEEQVAEKKTKLVVEKKAVSKPPQKKQPKPQNGNPKAAMEKKAVAQPPQRKQALNGNAKQVKAKQDQQETTKANGKPFQKKGGAPFKPKSPGKKPFVKKQQTQKPAAKKVAAK